MRRSDILRRSPQPQAPAVWQLNSQCQFPLRHRQHHRHRSPSSSPWTIEEDLAIHFDELNRDGVPAEADEFVVFARSQATKYVIRTELRARDHWDHNGEQAAGAIELVDLVREQNARKRGIRR